jgi:hypothetical protein
VPEEGFWNGGKKPCDVYECPYDDNACMGGQNNTCGDGFDPNYHVCGKCMDGYTLMGGKCLECSAAGLIVLLPIFGILIGLVLLVLLICFCIKKYFEYQAENAEMEVIDVTDLENQPEDRKVIISTPRGQMGSGLPNYSVDTPRTRSGTVASSHSGAGYGIGHHTPSRKRSGEYARVRKLSQDSEDYSLTQSGAGVGAGTAATQNELLGAAMDDGGGDVNDGDNENEAGLAFMDELGYEEDEIEMDDGAEALEETFDHLNNILKIVMGYLQCLCAVSFTMPSVSWPQDFIDTLVQPFSFLNFEFSQIFPVGCVIPWNFYLDQQIAFFLPLIAIATLMLLELYRSMKLTRSQCEPDCSQDHDHIDEDSIEDKKIDLRNSTWKFSLMSVFIMYPMLCQKMMAIFLCRKIEQKWYLTLDVTLECYDDQWLLQAILGSVGIIIYVIGVPVVFFVLLYQHKDQMDHPDVIAKVGFLYYGYAATFWLGELVEMTRKMVMSGLVMIIVPGSVFQIICAMAFCAFFLGVQVACNPFEDKTENKIAMWTLWGTALTVLFGLLIITSEGACNTDQIGMQLKTMANAIMIVNLFVFAMIMYWTARFVKEDFEGKGEIIMHLFSGGMKKLDEEAAKTRQDVATKKKAISEPDSVSKIEKEEDSIPDSQDIILDASAAKMLEGSTFIELVRNSFDRFDMCEAGVVTTEADIVGICLSVVCKMKWTTCTATIDQKAKAVVESLIGHGVTNMEDAEFEMTFEEFLDWFKAEIAPHGFLSIHEAQLNKLDKGTKASEKQLPENAMSALGVHMLANQPGQTLCPTCRQPVGELRRAYLEAECCVCLERVDQILVSECGHTLCKECADTMAPDTPRVECEDATEIELNTEMSETMEAIDAICAQASQEAASNEPPSSGGFFKGAAAEATTAELVLSHSDSALAIGNAPTASNIAADAVDLDLDTLLCSTFDRFDVYGEGTISGSDDLIGMCLNVGSKTKLGILSSTIDHKTKAVAESDPNFTMTCEEFSTWFKTEILPDQHKVSIPGAREASEAKVESATSGFFKAQSAKEGNSPSGGFFKGEASEEKEQNGTDGEAPKEESLALKPIESFSSAFLDIGGFFKGKSSSKKKARRCSKDEPVEPKEGFFKGKTDVPAIAQNTSLELPDVDEIMVAAARSGVDMNDAAQLTQFTQDYAQSKSNQTTPRPAAGQQVQGAEDAFFKGKPKDQEMCGDDPKEVPKPRKKKAPSNEAAWF